MGCCKDDHEVAAKTPIIDQVESWVRTTDEGKRWLSRMAADIGAPLQLTLPFKENHEDSV